MSSIIRNRNGVIEVSLGPSKPAHWRRPLQGYPQLRRQRGECTPLRRSRSVQRLKSFCGAKPTQKLRWTERGWSRGFSFSQLQLMDFSVGIDALEATAVGKSRPLPGVFLAVASLERVGARSTACVFAVARRKIGCAGQYVFAACPRDARATGVFVLRRRGWLVMVLGPASAKAGGQTGDDQRRSKGRRADRLAVPGRRTDRGGPGWFGVAAASPEGGAEAAAGRGRHARAWWDATSRSSGPCAGPWAGHAGGSGACTAGRGGGWA